MIADLFSSSQGLIAFITALSVLVLVHELGHFAVAKAVGIRVESFSLFFGAPLLSLRRAKQGGWRVRLLTQSWGLQPEDFTHGETEYAIRWIPFGGYVKMTGQSDFGEAEGAEDPWSFTAKPVWARAAVVAAGPLMNFVLAVAVFAGLNMTNGVTGRIGIAPQGIGDGAYMRVGAVEPSSAADSAGIAAGATWMSVNGVAATSWGAVDSAIVPGGSVVIGLVSADGTSQTLTLPGGLTDLHQAGITWQIDPVVGFVIPLEPADEAGLAQGDRILAVAGTPVTTWEEMSAEIRTRPGERIALRYSRGGAETTVAVTPGVEFAVDGGHEGEKLPFFTAVVVSVEQLWTVVGKMVRFLEQLVTGAISPKFVAGPIGIFQMSGAAAERGLASFVYFVAFLSAQLGFINLLPLAVLDGGHLVFFAYEAITRRRPSPKQQGAIQQIGMVILLGFMVFVTVMDIQRLMGM